ncbi:MAG TPA: NAD(P)-dependent glycerol-3-phosphate dehydrogenase [Gammaproteobacteria bacterium]|nr:NAD(P)-dependent glycerol-3-phosphate dehydrogenase [Gammaproteobacteria bacterium]
MTADEQPSSRPAIAVLGAGSWGTALAILLARNGLPVRLWDRDPEQVAQLRRERENRRYLPDIRLPETIAPTSELGTALAGADFALVVVPSAGFRSVLQQLRALAPPEFPLVWASKGLEPGSGKFLHQVVAEELPGRRAAAVLSGPSFATEVARGLPTAVTIASTDADFARRVVELVHCPVFRAYTSEDVIGVELGGAVKNVLAIGAGISDGLGYGANARAALITRGLAEIMRLGIRLGGRRETFMGLSGVGDLVLTCTDDQSRNRRLGLALGRGVPLDQAVEDIGQAVEGLHTAREVERLARSLDVDMPITREVKGVLYDGKGAATAVDALLARDPKPEGA